MSESYVKLFSSITESTVWIEPYSTRIVWIALLAMVDSRGCVYSSVPGLARRANVTREECEVALKSFLAPDPDSRTHEHEGRRIEPIDGGWRLLNHAKYAAIRNEAERREYKAAWERENRAKNAKAAHDGVDSAWTNVDTHGQNPTNPTFPTAPTTLALTLTLQDQDQEHQHDSVKPAAKAGKSGRRGTRLPDGWDISHELRMWASSEHPDVRLETVKAEFIDYWKSVPGQRGCKLDWDAVFRNRVRDIATRNARPTYATNRESAAGRAERLGNEAIQRLEGELF